MVSAAARRERIVTVPVGPPISFRVLDGGIPGRPRYASAEARWQTLFARGRWLAVRIMLERKKPKYLDRAGLARRTDLVGQLLTGRRCFWCADLPAAPRAPVARSHAASRSHEFLEESTWLTGPPCVPDRAEKSAPSPSAKSQSEPGPG
jgi:hypothetical protein